MFRWALLLITVASMAQAQALNIYWVDVEGGAATLIVAPTGESLLIDTGFPGQGDRDANRIVAAMKDAGLDHLDHLLITHYHVDHVGGAMGLASKVEIRHFFDHGENVEREGFGVQQVNAYTALAGDKRTILKPGDSFKLGAAEFRVVSAAGSVIRESLRRGNAEKHCSGVEQKPEDLTENAQSVGLLMEFGKFSLAALGDLTWDREMQLACPENKIGEVTLLQATHHGFSNGQSGSPALIWSLRPQVVVVNNGGRKGFSNTGYETIAKIPDIEGIWQGHRGETNDAEHNTSEEMIANPASGAADQGHWIKATVRSDGTYTVTNGRNGFTKSYTAR